MFRKVTSFIMLYSFIIMVLSGIMLFISPFGRLSMMIKWEMFGLDKMQWQALHLIFMLIFTLAGITHILYNWKPIKNYLKNRSKKLVVFTSSHIVAIAITASLFYVTINHMEPFESFVKMNKSFNEYWTNEFRERRMQEILRMRKQQMTN